MPEFEQKICSRGELAARVAALPQPVVVANPGGKTLVTNGGSNGKFVGVIDLNVGQGRLNGVRYTLMPVFSNLLPAVPAMEAAVAALHDQQQVFTLELDLGARVEIGAVIRAAQRRRQRGDRWGHLRQALQALHGPAFAQCQRLGWLRRMTGIHSF